MPHTNNDDSHLKLYIPMVVHEMLTSIHIAKSYNHLFLEEEHQNSDKYKAEVNTELQHLERLIKKLTHLYRYNQNSVSLHLELVAINRLIEKEFNPFILSNTSINITLNLPRKLQPILVDPGEIKELLRVMIENGIKYTPKSGYLTVSVQQDYENTYLTFFNTGEGIKDIPKALKPFSREDTLQDGSGLGLLIAQNIVHLHKGTLTLKSDGASYTEVNIAIPNLEMLVE